jgi:hypothetical protein
MNSRKLAIITILIALSIGTNYSMISFYNVKFMDLIVFVGGFCFGPLAGSLIGIISWAVYGTLNPIGFSLPVWLATMLSEPIYGVAGALMRKRLSLGDFGELKNERVITHVFFGIFGMFLTFAYDVITNIVFGYVNNWNILFSIIFGFVPFGLVHMVSNACFFGMGGVPAINAILNVIGGENSDISKK